MDVDVGACTSTQPKVYTTSDGRAVLEQSGLGTVVLTPEQIIVVIRQLHGCYDYCATWKDRPDTET